MCDGEEVLMVVTNVTLCEGVICSLTLIKIKGKSIFCVPLFILEVITRLIYSLTVICANETPSE